MQQDLHRSRSAPIAGIHLCAQVPFKALHSLHYTFLRRDCISTKQAAAAEVDMHPSLKNFRPRVQ